MRRPDHPSTQGENALSHGEANLTSKDAQTAFCLTHEQTQMALAKPLRDHPFVCGAMCPSPTDTPRVRFRPTQASSELDVERYTFTKAAHCQNRCQRYRTQVLP